MTDLRKALIELGRKNPHLWPDLHRVLSVLGPPPRKLYLFNGRRWDGTQASLEVRKKMGAEAFRQIALHKASPDWVGEGGGVAGVDRYVASWSSPLEDQRPASVRYPFLPGWDVDLRWSVSDHRYTLHVSFRERNR